MKYLAINTANLVRKNAVEYSFGHLMRNLCVYGSNLP